jgi:8,8a-deoxyoleandolide synthase
VISLLSFERAAHPEFSLINAAAAGSLALIQALGDASVHAPLWILTRGAVSVSPADPLTSPAQAELWGLGQIAGLEHPDRWGGLIDLPPAIDDQARAQLAAALAGTREDQLALRPSGIHTRRLTPAPLTAPPPGPARGWDGTTLITGGTGSLGTHLARWLVTQGARRLVLTSRRGPSADGADALQRELQARGATVTITACDASDKEALRALLDDLSAAGEPVRSVIHAAGLGQTTPLTAMQPGELAAVITAKATGADHLDELLAGRPLDNFILFSSISATWGSTATGAYAAANAHLDAVAARRRQRGETATSIAWGVWDGSAMVSPDAQQQLTRRGVLPMPPALALAALGQALDHDDTHIAIARMDWPLFTTAYTAARPRPLIDDLPGRQPGPRDTTPATPPPAATLRNRLPALPPDQQHTTVLDLVRTTAAEILGYTGQDGVPDDRPFVELGLDSLTAVEVRNSLNLATGLRLPAMLLFDHPTPARVADFVLSALAGSGGGQQAPDEATGAADSNERLAVIYRKVSLLGRLKEVEGLLNGAACLRQTTSSPQELVRGRELVRLAQGPEQPELICFPPFAPVEQSLQFARFATSLRGQRNVSVAPVPGFLDGELLAADVDVLVAGLADMITRCADGAPFALLGYSSSGWVAQAVAMHMESRGLQPSGVVLLDTYLPDTMTLEVRKAMTYEVNERRKRFTSMNFASLTALGAYRSMFRDWTAEPVAAPTLFVRPADCIPGSPEEPVTGDNWRAIWPFEHAEAEVPGDHCTMVADYADVTAETIHTWLAKHAR